MFCLRFLPRFLSGIARCLIMLPLLSAGKVFKSNLLEGSLYSNKLDVSCPFGPCYFRPF